MGMHPVPSAFEARSNAVFDAVMWALARPGHVRDLPDRGMEQIVEALIDRECRVFCDNDALGQVAQRAGAQMAEVDVADHLFVDVIAAGVPERVRCGSDLHPDEGATLVVRADLSAGQQVRLSGPGVDGAVQVRIGGLPVDFWFRRAQMARYPMGFEMLLVDGARVLGVPRSTIVEVL